MTRRTESLLVLTVLTIVLGQFGRVIGQSSAAPREEHASPIEVLGGTVTFEAATNVSAINVHGKSASLSGRARIRQTEGTLAIEQLQASVPVNTLATGLGLRDGHMRKYIFTTQDGKTPDLTFAADTTSCAAPAGAESACTLAGQLAIRGTARPFTMTLRIAKAGTAYRAWGDGAVRLSSYGIERPSQLGVTTTDEVKLHLEFTARPSAGLVAVSAGGAR